MKSPKTGLLHAAVQTAASGSSIVPLAVSYDLVLEDHILAHQGSKRRPRRVRARSRRDGALRGGLSVARVRDVRRADSARRLRPGLAPRCDDARASDARRDRPSLQGAADRRGRRRDAAVDRAARARGAGRRIDRIAARGRGRQHGRQNADARRSRTATAPLESRNIIHVERAAVSASANAPSCAITRVRSSISSTGPKRPPARTRSAALRQQLRSSRSGRQIAPRGTSIVGLSRLGYSPSAHRLRGSSGAVRLPQSHNRSFSR